MICLPSKEEQQNMVEIKKWIYIDPKDFSPKLRDDTPKEIRRMYDEIKIANESMFE